MDITITFPGGKKVNADVNGMIIPTDQPKLQGGDNSAPSPFAHFLASIGTCAGSYVLSFCQERKIPTDRITITERLEYAAEDGKSKLVKIVLDINVPPDFPEKYRNALIKVADQCAVKKTMMNPPQFEIKTVVGE
jgi:ribosomal protein S12 methylthiotransferase accessory factor